MIRRFIAAVLAVVVFSAGADTAAVHTNGDVHSRVLAKIFFPNAPVVASPGADGLLVWKKLDDNKADVAIQVALAVHFLPTLHAKEDPAGDNVLLATLASSRQALVVRPDFPASSVQDLRNLGRPLTVGWIGHACKTLLADVFAKNKVEFIYAAYKTPQEAVAAMMGGHIDAICPAAASLRQMAQAKTGKVLLDITEHHGFFLTTYLFAGRDMPEATRQDILQKLTRPLTTDELATAEANGFTLNVRTGQAATTTFAEDRKRWNRIVQKGTTKEP